MSLLVERTYNTFDYDPSEAMNPDQPFVFAEGVRMSDRIWFWFELTDRDAGPYGLWLPHR